MVTNGATKDSIPRARVHQVFQTLARLLSSGGRTTFDAVRAHLQMESGRKSPSTRHAQWNTARHVLSDLRRLGFVELGTLPRKKSELDGLSASPCELTSKGRSLAELHGANKGKAYDQLLVVWLNEHAYFRAFLARLQRSPLFIPDVTSIRQLGVTHPAGLDLERLADAVLTHCRDRLQSAGLSDSQFAILDEGVRKRLELVEKTVDLSALDTQGWVDLIEQRIVLPAFLLAESLAFDAVTFEKLINISQDFLCAAFTSSLPDFTGRAGFATCDFRPDVDLSTNAQVEDIVHHGQTYAAQRFNSVIAESYKRLAGTTSAYVDAYALRASVCLELRLQPSVFSACLATLMGAGTSAGMTIYTELPFSPKPSGEDYVQVGRQRIGRIKLTFANGG